MSFEVIFHDDCAEWFEAQDDDVKEKILAYIGLLEELGPLLGRPHVDTLKGSKVANLKELRPEQNGTLRILFAFDKNRKCILLCGGRKNNKKWYASAIKKAELLFKEHNDSLH